jgi:hypothetical protein
MNPILDIDFLTQFNIVLHLFPDLIKFKMYYKSNDCNTHLSFIKALTLVKCDYTIVYGLIQTYTRMYTEVYENIQGIHSYTPKIRFFQCKTSHKSPIINMSYKINKN